LWGKCQAISKFSDHGIGAIINTNAMKNLEKKKTILQPRIKWEICAASTLFWIFSIRNKIISECIKNY